MLERRCCLLACGNGVIPLASSLGNVLPDVVKWSMFSLQSANLFCFNGSAKASTSNRRSGALPPFLLSCPGSGGGVFSVRVYSHSPLAILWRSLSTVHSVSSSPGLSSEGLLLHFFMLGNPAGFCSLILEAEDAIFLVEY